MVDNVLTLRSPTAGNRPPGGRLTGELYVNMAEGQLGFVNASGANQDLLSITMFSTAATYAVGAFVLQAGQLYRCVLAVTTPGSFAPQNWTQVGGSVSVGDSPPGNAQPGALWYDSTAAELYVLYNDGNSTQWVVAVNQGGAYLPLNGGTMTGALILNADPTVALGAATKEYSDQKLPLSGGTLTGPLVLVADPTAALGAATKQYVDAANVRYKNRIINGDTSVAQRGTSGTQGTGAYTIDRWRLDGTQVGKGAWSQGPGWVAGFSNTLGFQTASAYALLASDGFIFDQSIEAINFGDSAWGTANAQPIVLEFWANSTLGGTFGGSIRNAATTRSYPFSFALVANTWAKIRINIPGDTAGTWVLAGNAASVIISFSLGAGSSQSAAAGTWVNGSFLSVPGAVSVVGTASATFALTGVALMVGSAAQNAEPEFKKFSDNLLDCQRYYYNPGGTIVAAYNAPGSGYGVYVSRPFMVSMRANPATSGATLGNSTGVGSLSLSSITPNSALWVTTTTGTGAVQMNVSGDIYDADL